MKIQFTQTSLRKHTNFKSKEEIRGGCFDINAHNLIILNLLQFGTYKD